MKKIRFPFQRQNAPKRFKRTLVAVPTTGVMYPAMVNDLIALLTKSNNWALFHTVDNCVIQDARNQAARRMLEADCDGLLFIDSDQVFKENALDKLIETNKDIVGAPIIRKAPPYYPNISRWNEATQEYEICENYPQNNLFCVDYIGMGFVYIRREVFEKLEYPYFDFDWHINDKYKKGEKMIGEDVYFCRKARAAGFKIWANPFVEVGHLGNFNYLPKLYFNFEKARQSIQGDKNGKGQTDKDVQGAG